MAESDLELAPSEVTEGATPPLNKKGKKKKKGKGKLLIISLIVILLLGGGSFGVLAFLGKIPGVSFGRPLAKGKASNSAAGSKAEKKGPGASPAVAKAPTPKTPARPEPEAVQIQPPKPAPDLEKGAKSVARVWERIDPAKVVEMAASYQDPELARILNKMDAKKTAAIIGIMDAKRAALLSKEMEKQAAVPPPAVEPSL